MLLIASERWKSAYPDACIGILALSGVHNPAKNPELAQQKHQLEERLRTEYTGMDRAALKSHPALAAYAAYYKAFKKTYHVQLQLESIVFKGKFITRMGPLNDGSFLKIILRHLHFQGHTIDVHVTYSP